MVEEAIDYYKYDVYKPLQTGEITNNLLDHYNSQLVDNQISYDDLITFDDGARKHDISSWGCHLDYTGEGSIGLYFPDIPKKNSNYSYSRMYYYSGEPDFQLITRFELDMMFVSLRLKYNDNKIIGIIYYQDISSFKFRYHTYFEFNRDVDGIITIGDVFVEFVGGILSLDDNTFLSGYKTYYRDDIVWSPQEIKNINLVFEKNKVIEVLPSMTLMLLGDRRFDSSRRYFVGDAVYQPQKSKSGYSLGAMISSLKSTTSPNIIHKISNTKPFDFGYNHSISSMIYTPENISYGVFVEGLDDIDLIISIVDTNNNIYGLSIQNNYVDLKNLSSSNYYTLSYNNYYKKFNPTVTKKMIKSEMFGMVGLSACDDMNNLNFKVKCVRVGDDHLIGYYEVVDNSYRIPNLNYNELYDITLIDNSMNLEQKILSNRRPTPYKPLSDLNKVSLISSNRMINNKVSIDWRIIGDFEETTLYKSTTPFTKNELPSTHIYKSDIHPHYIDLDLVFGVTYYYMASAKRDDVQVYSELSTITF